MHANLSQDKKQQIVKDIILDLHKGLTVEAAKDRFEQQIGGISATEIAQIEQGLINDGVSVDEIKKFCNVHALLFEASLDQTAAQETSPSHPVFLFKLENREIEKITAALKEFAAAPGNDFPATKKRLADGLEKLRGLNIHYERKEQLLFPFLEKQGFMGPSKVMWGKHNEIRDLLKGAITKLQSADSGKLPEYLQTTLNPLIEEINGMIFKEENILFPAAMEKLAPKDWVNILKESQDIGYVFIESPRETEEMIKELSAVLRDEPTVNADLIRLPTGDFRAPELLALLNTLPFDITFVDKDDTVRYFTQGTDRIFSRTKAVIGRKVQNCHPPQSVDVVLRILDSFKKGQKDSYAFWLNLKGKLVYIRYLALRDADGKYLGTVEITQDITGIKKIEGEKRLIDARD